MRRCLLLLPLASCTLGSVGGGSDDDTALPGTAQCQAELTLSGTLASPGAPPTQAEGCVPQGTWTVNVAVASEGSCGPVTVPGVYTYAVVGEGRDETITSTSNTDEEAQLGIHDQGDGTCEGSFEHVWPVDGGFAVVLLKADGTAWDQTIHGTGTYQLWSAHP